MDRLRMCGPVLAVSMGLAAAAAAGPVLRVNEDRGGPVPDRLYQIAQLRQSGTRVEIGPGRCLSSCTMLLAVPGACVHPAAQLGFHGPGSQHTGIGLAPEAFDHWSRVIAAHYPPSLRRWYMATGRYRLTGFHMLSGTEAIAMGARACPADGT